MILDWPSFGADQKRLICVGDTAVTVSPDGASGTVAAFAPVGKDIKIRTEDSNNTVR